MRPLESRIDPGSAEFARNRAHSTEQLALLRERLQWAIDGGPGRARSIERHLSRGKILTRDRIDLVIDGGTPFLELSTLSGFGQYDDAAPGSGLVTGIGLVHDVRASSRNGELRLGGLDPEGPAVAQGDQSLEAAVHEGAGDPAVGASGHGAPHGDGCRDVGGSLDAVLADRQHLEVRSAQRSRRRWVWLLKPLL